MGYVKHSITGVTWVAALRFFTRGVTILRIAILARILTPTQFGIFGIASLVLSFIEIITETGINVFLIQEKDEIKKYVSTAWVVSIVRGVIISLLILILTPVIAIFFNSPETIPLLILISIVPFIRGFINPSVASFQKDLTFHKEFFFRSSIFLVEAVFSIIVVFITRSAIGIVWGLIIGALFEVVISFLYVKPIPTFLFQKDQFKRIFHQGKWVTMFGIFSYISQEGDGVIVGKILGTASLGIYQIAYKLSTLPLSEISDVVNKVVFPVYSKISGDRGRLLKALIKTSLLSSALSIILGFIIFAFPNQIITIVLGENWLSAVPIIKVLAIYGILRATMASFSPAFLSIGKQNYVATMTFVRVFALMITIIPLIMWYGLVGAGYAAILSIVVEVPVIMYYTLKVFKR
jgi:O-antigen/teichoic acid export membrane protein